MVARFSTPSHQPAVPPYFAAPAPSAVAARSSNRGGSGAATAARNKGENAATTACRAAAHRSATRNRIRARARRRTRRGGAARRRKSSRESSSGALSSSPPSRRRRSPRRRRSSRPDLALRAPQPQLPAGARSPCAAAGAPGGAGFPRAASDAPGLQGCLELELARRRTRLGGAPLRHSIPSLLRLSSAAPHLFCRSSGCAVCIKMC
ncbi:unnamed protein product [Urochloa humidicola]